MKKRQSKSFSSESLDHLVAEKVLGWNLVDTGRPGEAYYTDKRGGRRGFASEWHPSFDDAQAHLVLRELQIADWELDLRIDAERGALEDAPLWRISLKGADGGSGEGEAYLFARAACLAALDFAKVSPFIPALVPDGDIRTLGECPHCGSHPGCSRER